MKMGKCAWLKMILNHSAADGRTSNLFISCFEVLGGVGGASGNAEVRGGSMPVRGFTKV